MSSELHADAPIVLVGAGDDEQLAAVAAGLRARAVEPVIFDSLSYPSGSRVTLGADLREVLIDGHRLGKPGAVYLRSLYGSPASFGVDADAGMAQNWRGTLAAFREKAELLAALLRRWEHLGVPLYNPLSASERVCKPYQLALLAEAGLPVPETLWTNDPLAVRRFARGRRTVYKPVAGGAATQELREADLTEERLARLAGAPVTFQELLPGDDLRIYVLDGEVVAGYRIESTAIDFRQHEQDVTPIDVDPGLAGQAVRAADVIGLRFAGMDVKAGADGASRILELNASPMFVGFDEWTGTDIVGRLADALIHAARGAP